jgi:serine/threonine protein kinase
MIWGFYLKLEDALNEVKNLQRLRHAHIVRLVGSYTQERNFSIHNYPVTGYDLATLTEHVITILQDQRSPYSNYEAPVSLGRFFSCLANAMDYICENTTKHMDIKPHNILVKVHPRYTIHHQVYIADFGIFRHFSSLNHSQTDSEIPRSPKYCAPEVDAEGK